MRYQVNTAFLQLLDPVQREIFCASKKNTIQNFFKFRTQREFRTQSNIQDGTASKTAKRLKSVDQFHKSSISDA